MKKLQLLTAFLILFSSSVLAQVDLQNTGILFVSGGTDIVYVNGALTNTSAGSLTNNGNLYVLRNLTNGQSAMPSGTGTLYLSGTSAQIVAGAQPFKTYNLVTNNSAGITLNANLSVAGQHTFTNGIVTTSVTPNYLIYEAGSSHTGSADTRHVNGWVKKIGSTDFIFPVGNGTYLRNAEVLSLSGSSEFNCKYNAPTINPLNVLAPILLADNNEYWDIPQVSGGTAQVRLNWDNSKVVFPRYPLTEIRVVQYSSALWTDRGGSATGDIYTIGSIPSGSLSTFGQFTFGSLDWFVAQQFLSFTAQRKQGYSLLEWKTTQDITTKQYEVERSDNALTYYSIGSQTALLGTTANNYTFNDFRPLSGTAWYRIKSVDRNGRFIYSRIVAVTEKNNNESSLYVMNNPVYQNIFLSASGNFAGEYDYSLYNVAGQLVQKGTITTSAGGITTLPLDAAVTPGVYVLDVHNNLHRLTKRVIVR